MAAGPETRSRAARSLGRDGGQRRAVSSRPAASSTLRAEATWPGSPLWEPQAPASASWPSPSSASTPRARTAMAWNGLAQERRYTTSPGSPALASTRPSASATATAPRCRLSTNPDRSTSARTSTAASLCKVLWGKVPAGHPAATRPGLGPPEGSVADSGDGARQAVHSPAVKGRVQVGEVGDDGGEGVDHRRVELGPGPVGDLLAGPVEGEGLAVGAVRGHGVEGVGDREHPGPGRDGLAGQAVGVALAVPALVVAADHLDGQGLDHVQIGPAQAVQGPLELGRPGPLGLVEVVDLGREDHQLAFGRLQLLQVAGARVHRLSRP